MRVPWEIWQWCVSKALLVDWASGIGTARTCRFPVVSGTSCGARNKVISPSPMSFGGPCVPYEGA